MNWVHRPFDPKAAEAISQKLNLRPLIGQLINQRGISAPDEAERFLHGSLKDLPNPFLLDEMDLACQRLSQAIARHEKILLFGDYDVDGITGTAQLTTFLREVGAEVDPLLPHRIDDGYGLTASAIQKILNRSPALVVTIDNGTNALAEIRTLRDAGIDVIVIDHHESPRERPPVVALINPKREKSKFPERDIASAGLVFLLLMALRKTLREADAGGALGSVPLKRYLELAAMGTIADLVPLTGTNRLLVKFGLEEINQEFVKPRWPGVRALLEKGAVRQPVDAAGIAFRVAPRLNAAGRLDDPHLALNTLLARETGEAAALAEKLEQLNRRRQQVEEKVFMEAAAMVERDQKNRRGLVVGREGWPLGVVGIVASRLTEIFGRPAIVLSLEGSQARGSARTIAGLSIYDALTRISDQMIRFGGHHAAAGMTIATPNFENFSNKFDESVRLDFPIGAEAAPVVCDASLALREINGPLLKDLALLGPHGVGNPEPLFETGEVQLEGARLVGKNHLKTLVCQDGQKFEAIGFGLAPTLKGISAGSWHRIAYAPQWNDWNGMRSIQLQINKIYP